MRRHGPSLKTLQIYNSPKESCYDFESDFSALTSFDAGDIDPYADTNWASRILAHNHKTLSRVKLGCERAIALTLSGIRSMGRFEQTDFTENLEFGIRTCLPENNRRSDIDQGAVEAPTAISTVESLHLVGIDCSYSPPIGVSSIVNIDKLTSLCLESCLNLGGSFAALSLGRTPDALLLFHQLRSFKLRQEDVDVAFQDSLKAFLCTCKALVHLAVLLEGSGPLLPPECCLIDHGSTLRTLVWDQRRKPQNKLDKSTNTATPSMMFTSLRSICAQCPNLQELGLTMNAFGDEVFQVCYSPPSSQNLRLIVLKPDHYLIPELKHLKTLNIRNLPIIAADTNTFSLERIHESVAMDVAKRLHCCDTRLEILGLGSTTWTDIWQGRSRMMPNNRCENYLCPRIYHVDYPMNLRGERQPMLTQIAQGTATEAKEYSLNLGIFEPYWLV